MFRYGGPIKEGVMHGMKDGGRIGFQFGGSGWHVPTATAAGTAATTAAGIAAINKARTANLANKFKGLFQVPLEKRITKAVRGTGRFLRKFNPYNISKWMSTQFPKATLSRYIPTGSIAVPTAAVAPYVYGAKKLQEKLPEQLKGEGGIYDTTGGWGAMGAGADIPPEVDEILRGKKIDITGKPLELEPIVTEDDKWDPGAGGKQYDPSTSPSAIAAAAKKARMEKLDSYLDMMGYDRAKRGALDKALIDASALVQDATTEAGSLKEADWGKLINRAIQTTSKRLDKPEQIREAVGLMMTKGEIEKDIAEGKGSQYDIKEKYLKGKLGEIAGERGALNKPTSLTEALNATKATDSKADRTGQALMSYYDGHLVPQFKSKLSSKKIKELGGEDIFKQDGEIALGDGVYQVSNSYIIVKGNKIIELADVFGGD
jgi:hypothetical protein